MNMPLLKVKDYESGQQLRKIGEELIELATASTRKEMLLESLDLLTATSTLITHVFTEKEINQGISESDYAMLEDAGELIDKHKQEVKDIE